MECTPTVLNPVEERRVGTSWVRYGVLTFVPPCYRAPVWGSGQRQTVGVRKTDYDVAVCGREGCKKTVHRLGDVSTRTSLVDDDYLKTTWTKGNWDFTKV